MKALEIWDRVGSARVQQLTEDFCQLIHPINTPISIDIYQKMLELGWEQFMPPVEVKVGFNEDIYLYFRNVGTGL